MVMDAFHVPGVVEVAGAKRRQFGRGRYSARTDNTLLNAVASP